MSGYCRWWDRNLEDVHPVKRRSDLRNAGFYSGNADDSKYYDLVKK